MAGESKPYNHLPSFYSDMFELGYEAVGEVDSRLEMFADWKKPNEEGVVYYLDKGQVRGVLLWNVWEQVEAARQLNVSYGYHDDTPDKVGGAIRARGWASINSPARAIT